MNDVAKGAGTGFGCVFGVIGAIILIVGVATVTMCGGCTWFLKEAAETGIEQQKKREAEIAAEKLKNPPPPPGPAKQPEPAAKPGPQKPARVEPLPPVDADLFDPPAKPGPAKPAKPEPTTKPDPAKPVKPEPAKPDAAQEKEAASKLRLAKQVIGSAPNVARRHLTEIVEGYPGTAAAQEAQALLDKLP